MTRTPFFLSGPQELPLGTAIRMGDRKLISTGNFECWWDSDFPLDLVHRARLLTSLDCTPRYLVHSDHPMAAIGGRER